MPTRTQRLATLVLLSGLAPATAYAQRPTSTPSAATAAMQAETPPSPPGFPGLWQNNLVLGGELTTQLQGQWNAPANAKSHVGVFNDTDLALYANYADWLSVNSDVKLQRNRNNDLNSYYPDRNSFFRSEGATLNQLYVTARPTDTLAVYGGKVHPAFGSAFENEPGIFYNFASDYEQDERIGFGTQWQLPDWLGLDHAKLSVETFYLDTSVLSTSLLSPLSLTDPTADRARRYARNQFGPSNTGSFDSFTMSLTGGTPERGLTYQVSLTREATADPAARTEFGQSVSVMYDPSGDGIPVFGRWGMTPFLEYTHFTNFAGIANLERHYAIGGLAFVRGRWNGSLAGGLRKSDGLSHDTDHQENVSLSYSITEHFQLGGGVGHVQIAGKPSWTIAPSLNYTRAF